MSAGPAHADPLPRLLAIMGSGETSPTMVKTHRDLLGRLGPPPVPAVLLDTPFGFQENADDLVARAQAYFRESLGARIELASFRFAPVMDAAARAGWLAQIHNARYVFAGPGSPSYALRHWEGSGLAGELREKLRTGGAVTFASAAALTLGLVTVPVYEIYKVGEDPHWLAGLDLLAEAGLRVALIPHYNNAEGGTHDTRYCYLGERRLARMEGDLADRQPGAFVLGVDEHTGLILDLDAGSATIVGLGTVTVRSAGRSDVIPAGATFPIPELVSRAAALASGRSVQPSVCSLSPPGAQTAHRTDEASPLMATVRDRQAAFTEAIARRDVAGALQPILELGDELLAWSRDPTQSDEMDRARDALHTMVASLGRLAETGARDPRDVVGPFVDALLTERGSARAEHRYEEADRIRDALTSLGVEVHDCRQGTQWELQDGGAGEEG